MLVCACTKMSGHAGSSKESSYVLLCFFLLPCVIFPCLLGISFIFQFSLVWGKTWAVLHLSPPKLFISCSLNNTDETEGGQNTSSKDTSHVHTSSAIQKEVIHFEYVVNIWKFPIEHVCGHLRITVFITIISKTSKVMCRFGEDINTTWHDRCQMNIRGLLSTPHETK